MSSSQSLNRSDRIETIFEDMQAFARQDRERGKKRRKRKKSAREDEKKGKKSGTGASVKTMDEVGRKREYYFRV